MINDPARIAYKSITPLEIEEEKPKRGLLSKGGSSRKEGDMVADLGRNHHSTPL